MFKARTGYWKRRQKLAVLASPKAKGLPHGSRRRPNHPKIIFKGGLG